MHTCIYWGKHYHLKTRTCCVICFLLWKQMLAYGRPYTNRCLLMVDLIKTNVRQWLTSHKSVFAHARLYKYRCLLMSDLAQNRCLLMVDLMKVYVIRTLPSHQLILLERRPYKNWYYLKVPIPCLKSFSSRRSPHPAAGSLDGRFLDPWEVRISPSPFRPARLL